MQVILTESEAETALLALKYFRRYHLGEYSEDDSWTVKEDIRNIERKLQDAS